ncbi:2-oxoglutarate synthase [Candidatus Dojkabacteria bacterium]|nr:2-oxoglutarate synthase [Candidatus Dojkabacteria bacterium]
MSLQNTLKQNINKTQQLQPILPECVNLSTKPHSFCPGCGHPIVLNALGSVIDKLGIKNETVFLIDIGCSLLAWNYFDVDTTQTHHGRTIPVATGFKRANPNSIVIAYLGDGGGYAIGLQHLIHATLRNEAITTIIVNNLNYGMTGGQMAPTTISDQPETTTAPLGRDRKYHGNPINGPEMLNNLGIENQFIARSAVNNPIQLQMTIQRAIMHQIDNKGFSFVEALSYCPTNWKTNAQETIQSLEKFKKYYPNFEDTHKIK